MQISARLMMGEMELFHSLFSEHYLNKLSGFLTDEKSAQPVALIGFSLPCCIIVVSLCLHCLTAVDGGFPSTAVIPKSSAEADSWRSYCWQTHLPSAHTANTPLLPDSPPVTTPTLFFTVSF